MYSAMGNNEPLATSDVDDTVQLRHMSPYWAVMLAGRDDDERVNMIPCMEEYILKPPHLKGHRGMRFGFIVILTLPFLTNSRDLAPRDLLVMPFDGGNKQVCCETYPKIEKDD